MRAPVDLPKAYRLLNHGPTVLVSALHGEHRNVMAAAWCMPLDFDPPKVAVVIDSRTHTRKLIEGSNRFAISVPCRAQAMLVTALGSHSGADLDKVAGFGVSLLDEPVAHSPLVGGCVAWLDCERLPLRRTESQHDLFIGQVRAAWADDRVFNAGRWHFDAQDDALRTLHHVAGGHYFAIGAEVNGAS